MASNPGTTTAPDRSSATAPGKLDPALIKLAAILMVGAIAGLLDTTIVNVGLGAIARFGAKATWLTSLTVFLAGSIACGAAWNVGSLIVFRIFQGLGGGMLLP